MSSFHVYSFRAISSQTWYATATFCCWDKWPGGHKKNPWIQSPGISSLQDIQKCTENLNLCACDNELDQMSARYMYMWQPVKWDHFLPAPRAVAIPSFHYTFTPTQRTGHASPLPTSKYIIVTCTSTTIVSWKKWKRGCETVKHRNNAHS